MSALTTYDHVPIATSIIESDFLASSPPSRSLRVCCYGSSSSQTPEKYLQEARHVGYLLAKRGHICVNGAGSFGCMAGLNDGACKGNGHIVGVIHEMWLVDAEDSSNSNLPWTNGTPVRDGGAHGAFNDHKDHQNDGPIREMLVAGGSDLQERKRLLMEGADALLVLPGGPGTWDELWEATCARGIGLSKIPIVVVNADGYYDPFLQIMQRAYAEGLTKLEPDELIHFEDTAEGAVRWIESIQDNIDVDVQAHPKPQEARTVIRKSSMMTLPPLGRSDSWFFGPLRRSFSRLGGQGSESVGDESDESQSQWFEYSSDASSKALYFGVGLAIGAIASKLLTNARAK